MKLKLIIAICTVIITILIIKTQTKQEPKLEFSSDLDCFYQDNSNKIKDTFPFSEADKIEIVAFGEDFEARMSIKNEIFQLLQVPRMGDTIKINNRKVKFREINVLNEQEVKELFSILFNYQTPDGNSVVADCYEPHHAILFYKAGKAIDFLELCFHCRNYRNSEKDSFNGFCLETYSRLERFFKSIGVESEVTLWKIKKLQNRKKSL